MDFYILFYFTDTLVYTFMKKANKTHTLRQGAKVKSIIGSSVVGGSSKAIWEKSTGLNFGKCCVEGCKNAAAHGAHVKRYWHCWQWCIMPTCQKHNPPSCDAVYRVKANTILVEDPRSTFSAHYHSWKFDLKRKSCF
ncbi:hypothetical protein WA158_008490 [Blastocystis sp. Blastoise]